MPAAPDTGEVSNASFGGSITGSIGGIRPSHNLEETTGYLVIAKEVLLRGTPLGVAALAQFSISTMLVAMVGKMVGVSELGATSLAFGLINATAYSLAAGFSGALETVLSHSYGRDPTSKMYGVYAQRMALLLLVVSACIGPILAFADVLLDAIGQNPEVVYYTGIFCRVALFGVYPLNVLEILRRYYACQHLSNPLSVNLIAGAIAFPALLYPMIKLFGYVGAPVAWVMLILAMPASLLFYLVYSKRYKKTWGGWDAAALRNWGSLTKLAFASMAMMLSEWASLEVNAITAGFAPPKHLAAFSIVYQTSGILWSLTSGIFIEAAVLVGNALGQSKPNLARRSAHCSIFLAAAHAVLNLTVLYMLRYQVPRAFTDDEEVIHLFVELLPYFFVYHIFDCVQSTAMGCARGAGKQVIGSIAIAIVYSIVGVPLGIVLFNFTNLGVRALWLGPAFGVSCVGFPIYVYLLWFYIKWDQIQLGGEDVPSLSTSFEGESLASRNLSSSPSGSDADGGDRRDGDGDGDGFGGSTPGLGTRRSSFRQGSVPVSPRSEASEGLAENFSFSSHFHIPGRHILVTPAVPAGPSPQQHQRLRSNRPPRTGGFTPATVTDEDGDMPAALRMTPLSHVEGPAALRGAVSRTASSHRPPSSATSRSSSSGGSNSNRRRRGGAHDARHSRSPSSSSSSDRPGRRLRTPRPSSRPGTPSLET